MAKADELGFSALIKPKIEEIPVEEKVNIPDIKIDNSIDIQKDIDSNISISDKKSIELSKKQTDKKTKNQSNKLEGKVDAKKDNLSDIESSLTELIATRKSKKKNSKVFVGLHLPEDVDEVLTQFKKDTDIDRSEAVASFVRIMLKDYFDK